MEQIKCITFDKAAQDALPENIKQKMQADREVARSSKPYLESKASIASDLFKEGEVTRAECFRVEMDLALGDNTGDLKFEKNDNYEKGEM